MVHRPVHLSGEPDEPATAHIETILWGRLLKYPHQVMSLPPLVVEVVELLRKEQTPILVRPSQTADIRCLLLERTLQGKVSSIVSRCL
jgi:hypothetical protein